MMKEIRDLRLQLVRLVSDHLQNRGLDPDKWALSPPTAQQQGILQQVLTAGLVDQVPPHPWIGLYGEWQ